MVSNNFNDMVASLVKSEIARKDEVKDSVNDIQTFAKSDVTQVIQKISINDLYEAPHTKEWNNFSKLNPDSQYELIRSIVENNGEILQPIIVWNMPKENIEYLYEGVGLQYDFNNSNNLMMILSGHSRCMAYKKLKEETNNPKYDKIDCIIKTGITEEVAKYIIKITNVAVRTLSPKEKRENIQYLYRILQDNNEGGYIAEKIAKDSNMSLRSVKYQLQINNNLIPEIIDMYDNEKISLRSAIKLCGINKNLQRYMHNNYQDKMSNKIISHMLPSTDRKESIDILFKNDKIEEYTNVTISIRTDLEQKFRKMTSRWLQKNM